MTTRETVAAWLHVAVGGFVLMGVSVLWLLAALLAPYFEGTSIPAFVAMFGRPFAAALIVLACVELLAAIAVLRGRSGARVVLLGLSVLLLPVFPIGTAVALCSGWAFLLKPPAVRKVPRVHEASA